MKIGAELLLGSRRATRPRAAPRLAASKAAPSCSSFGVRLGRFRALFFGIGRFLKKMPRFAGRYLCEAIRIDTPRAV